MASVQSGLRRAIRIAFIQNVGLYQNTIKNWKRDGSDEGEVPFTAYAEETVSTLGSARYSFLKRRTISLLMFLEKEWKRLLIIVALCPEDLYQKKRTEFERQKLERQQVIDILIALKVFQICSSFFFGISFKTVTADAQYDSTKLRETVSNYSVNLSCLTGNAPRLDLFAFNQDHLVSVF